MGLYAFVTKEQFLAFMKRWGKGEYNGIRHLAPHVMMQIDNLSLIHISEPTRPY